MSVTLPAAWSNPTTTAIDPVAGGPLPEAVFANIGGNLYVLGGADGNSGIATPYSLLTNSGVENWQRGNGPFTTALAWTADRWNLNIGGPSTASVSRSTTVDVGSGFSLAFTYTFSAGGSGYLSQKIEDSAQLAGRVVTFTVRVFTTVAGVYAQINDNSGNTAGTANTTINTWETISVTRTIVGAATAVTVQVVMPQASTTCYIDNLTFVIGPTSAGYRPVHPADDLVRCQRYYEIIGGGGSNLIVEGIATAAGQTARLVLPYKVQKPVSPIVTRVGTWNLLNATGQPTISGDLSGCYLTITSSAAGQFSAFNNAVGAWVTVEANI